ncbi:hypothetical protein KFK09_009614 [Dendrobium nobile]|uniref:Uncharacterized protein n=1 Tax=Dendrobium nobile TaxID=94219 RepID=A0A8T3BHM4_DENNO|nr:hypothetical protein KFK09_009614 [Dendrobium nobile]
MRSKLLTSIKNNKIKMEENKSLPAKPIPISCLQSHLSAKLRRSSHFSRKRRSRLDRGSGLGNKTRAEQLSKLLPRSTPQTAATLRLRSSLRKLTSPSACPNSTIQPTPTPIS